MLPEPGNSSPIVGALQPGYLPWAGFFDQVFHADLFILYDDLAYTRKSWRNRNRIKGPRGSQWLAVPVKARAGSKIHEVEVDNSRDWSRTHWKTLEHCYAGAPYFDAYRDAFRDVYRQAWTHLCELDVRLIHVLLQAFGIRTPVVRSSELALEEGFRSTGPADHPATRRIVHFMKVLGAERFLEGQAGKKYIREEILKEAGITVRYQVYEPRPYPQPFGAFVPFLSAVDLLFNCGPGSLEVLLNPSPYASGGGGEDR